MTRQYGNIKEVYINGKGWINYTGQCLLNIEMLSVSYVIFDSTTDEIIASGTEDFSRDRWCELQEININTIKPNNNPINTIKEVEKMYINKIGYIWEICEARAELVNSLTSDHCTGLEVVKLAEYLYRISFSTYNRSFNFTIDTLNEKQGDLRTKYYKNRLKNIL